MQEVGDDEPPAGAGRSTTELRRPREGGGTLPELPLDTVVFPSCRQISCSVGDEMMMLHLHDGVCYGLDPVGARIWKLLDEGRTLSAIRDLVAREFDVDPGRCERDLLELVGELLEAGLVEFAPEAKE